ncbi:MAG: cytochrome c nitrite reductase small subunit [Candidatus Omnitrophica bacterium]|nr:cytochrome c nitrite reductase small subunit [Candidatus Omnitrophota bacterium]
MRPWLRWIPSLLLVAVGILAGVGGYTFYYAKGASYFSDDPKACMNCHVMQDQFDSWVKSSHHAVATCNNCHVPHELPWKYVNKGLNGWNHSKAFTFQNFPEPIRITLRNLDALQNNCLHCHNVLVSEILEHEKVSGKSQRCTECHRGVGHMDL